ncbi:MAG TPA: hypothetical protein VJ995_08715 [Geothermobacteraceae bacterium]|nr:hypothetical protein [Geothermobacteraceae bacterium]
MRHIECLDLSREEVDLLSLFRHLTLEQRLMILEAAEDCVNNNDRMETLAGTGLERGLPTESSGLM